MATTKKKRPTSRSRGTIAPRGPSKWLVRIYRGLDDSGKRRYDSKVVHGQKKDAERELTKMLREADTLPHVRPNSYTLGQFVEEWLRAKTGVSPSTLRDYRKRLTADILPHFSPTKLDKLRGTDVQILFKELVEGPEPGRAPVFVKDGRKVSPRTVEYTHTILKACLSDAVEQGLIGRNPVQRIARPKRRKAEVRVLTPEQARTVMEWAEEHDAGYEALWTLFLTSGLRPGEALALKWRDIVEDPATGAALLHVRRALKEDGTVSDTKTVRSSRTLSIPPQAVAALRRHKARQAELALKVGARFNRDGGWVFTNEAGKLMDLAKVRKRWKRACRKAEVPEVRLYDTRHTHATALLIARVSPKIVQERLGHSNVTLTLSTYSHVLPETERQMAEVVSTAFFPADKTG